MNRPRELVRPKTSKMRRIMQPVQRRTKRVRGRRDSFEPRCLRCWYGGNDDHQSMTSAVESATAIYEPILDASESEFVPTLTVPSGNSYAAAAAFDLVDLEAEVFVVKYAVGGWLSGEIPFQWTRSCNWWNQCACHNGNCVRRRGVSLAEVGRAFLRKGYACMDWMFCAPRCYVQLAEVCSCIARLEKSAIWSRCSRYRRSGWRRSVGRHMWIRRVGFEIHFLRKNGP